ncbi:MAG: MFS transporter [Rhodospirillales bacterium]|nr:MFS transporter [Rhodospirillales bacterium]
MAEPHISPHYRVYAGFFFYAAILGAIFPRLGDLQLQMAISEGTLGIALMGGALGTQISLMFVGPVLERFGYRASVIVAIPVLGLAEVAATQAPGPELFFVSLVVAGLAIGALEIILNLEADRTELLMGCRIMNRAHAFWSFGFFTAGIVSALVVQFQIGPTTHLLGMTAVTSLAMVLVFRNFQPAPSRVRDEGARPRFVRPSGPILLIVVFTLSAMLLEGASADWSVIFMRDSYDLPASVNALAFAVGALAQALTRFFADGLVERFGPLQVARALIIILGGGVVLVTFSNSGYLALLGFALMGTGTSALFPLAMSAAAQRTDRPAATNVAALAQLSFITFLVAPPLLGFVAEHFGIRASFGICIPMVILSWFTRFCLDPKRRP